MSRVRLITDMEDECPPLLPEEHVGKNLNPIGNSIFSVEIAMSLEGTETKTFYCQLPQKFNKKVWFMRGNYCVVTLPNNFAEMVNEEIMGLIVRVLSEEHIKQMSIRGEWPKVFAKDVEAIKIHDMNMGTLCVAEINDSESSSDYY